MSVVDDFLNSKPTYLSGLDKSIQSGKAQRRAAQQAARGQQTMQRGLGKIQGMGGGMNPQSFLNPTPVGATLPGMGPQGARALGTGADSAIPARVAAGGQRATGALGAGGPAAAGAGAQPTNLGNIPHQPLRAQGVGAGSRGALGAGPGKPPIQGPKLPNLGAVAGPNAPKGAAGFAPSSQAATVKGAKGLLQGKGLTGIFSGVTRQGMMKGAGVAGTGYMLSGVIDGLDIGGENSDFDRGASGGILGAALAGGGAIALGAAAGGPVTIAAAAGGALLFGGYQALFGEGSTTPEQMGNSIDDTRDTIESIGSMYGLDGGAMQEIMMQFDASTGMMLQQKDKAGLKNYLTGLTSQLPAMMLQQKEGMEADQKETDRYDRVMAMQAQFAPMFERQMDTANQHSQMAYDQQISAADVLVDRQPQLAALVKSSAGNDLAAQSALMASYGKQIAMGPAIASDTEELQRRLEQEQLLNDAMR